MARLSFGLARQLRPVVGGVVASAIIGQAVY